MLRLRKVAITGLPGSGKTTAATFLRTQGVEIIDADEVAYQLLDPETECGKQIIDLLGEGVLVDKSFCRQRIADKVFANHALLLDLEGLLHPLILEEIEKHYKRSKASFFAAEVPLLFECGWERYFDQTVLITTKRPPRFEERLWRFWPEERKKEHADLIIENDGSIEDFEKQLFKILTIR